MAQCINCDSDSFRSFFIEEVPCAYCDEVNEIEYRICTECGMVGKFIDDKLISGAVFTDEDTQQLFDSNVEQMIDLFGSIANPQDVEVSIKTMKDMIHKCLRCDTPAFEKAKGLWHCPECGFEWEVIPGV